MGQGEEMPHPSTHLHSALLLNSFEELNWNFNQQTAEFLDLSLYRVFLCFIGDICKFLSKK